MQTGRKNPESDHADSFLDHCIRVVSAVTGHSSGLRGTKMERVSEALQFPVIIMWSRAFSVEPQLL